MLCSNTGSATRLSAACRTHTGVARPQTGRHYSALRIINPSSGDLFYLRILLTHIKGATCFNDLKTRDVGVFHNTFKEAAVLACTLLPPALHPAVTCCSLLPCNHLGLTSCVCTARVCRA